MRFVTHCDRVVDELASTNKIHVDSWAGRIIYLSVSWLDVVKGD